MLSALSSSKSNIIELKPFAVMFLISSCELSLYELYIAVTMEAGASILGLAAVDSSTTYSAVVLFAVSESSSNCFLNESTAPVANKMIITAAINRITETIEMIKTFLLSIKTSNLLLTVICSENIICTGDFMIFGFVKFLIIYLLIISAVAAFITLLDKYKAVNHKWRIPEATLLTVGLLGGSFSMYITMKIIKHKTKHLKFMVGLPIEILLDAIIIAVFLYFINN